MSRASSVIATDPQLVHLPAGGYPEVRLAVRAGVLPPVRFVIATTGRSGSVLLVTLLSSTPGVRCSREALGRRPFAAHPWRRLHAHAARAALRGAIAWGTSMHPEELLAERVGDRKQWFGRLHDSGFKVVTLVRRNPVSAGLSAVIADARGAWHHRADSVPPPVRLDLLTVLRAIEFSEQKAAELRALVGERSHLSLTYEDSLRTPADQQETVALVRRYLGLPPAPAPASSPLVRLSAPVHEQVENFEEIVAMLRPTHFGRYLEELT